MIFRGLLLTMLLPAAPLLAAADEDVSVFEGTPWQSLAALIAFTVLFFGLKKYAWGPILQGLQDREQKIKDDLAKAQRTFQDAQKLLDEHRALMATADQEARKIIDAGRRDAETAAAQIREQAEKEITAVKQRARQEINAAREQALAEIFSRVAVISSELAGSILKREINPDTHRELVERSLSQLESRNSN
ncbi:MAG: F0F1 ATP synthase subunit B [Phycisphaeraceae bacterium]|nr:F0F1 ATP synthase subunit B [Phycisphaeraceae bacterium]